VKLIHEEGHEFLRVLLVSPAKLCFGIASLA
jgi:hypothetical protein